ncbi:MAG TPA: DUF3311 domain-containing protein [Streptosporangiaceae bacterium]|jgi:hypothetical protein|nr:DUF3311 domain-containing protein [Streptosporangiaceae bacterium]
MLKPVAAGFLPYVAMVAGVPFFNSSANIGGLPLLGLWILIWVVATPLFLLAAYRLLPRAEREEGGQ